MPKSILFVALLGCFTLAQSAPPSATVAAAAQAAASAPNPLIGQWTWTLPGQAACTETLHYRADGTRSGRSGDEATQSRYDLSPLPSLLGFYRLSETVTESNGKPDCAGDTHEVADKASVRFIQFSPQRDRFIVCKAESLQACFGPLKRVTP